MLSIEPQTGALIDTEALSLSKPQSALKMLGVVQIRNVDIDFRLTWDPLTSHYNTLSQLLTDSMLSARQISFLHITLHFTKL